jgi:hypothetical protein
MASRKSRLLARLDNQTLPLQVAAVNARPAPIPNVMFDEMSFADQERFRSFEDPEGKFIYG